MGDYYKALDNVENVLRHRAKGFESNPGDNGVNALRDLEGERVSGTRSPTTGGSSAASSTSGTAKGYNNLMTEEDVKAKLLKTPSGKFEFKSGFLEAHADYIQRELGVPARRRGG
jgi:thiosulfate reductase / polysulfide reductase chain A